MDTASASAVLGNPSVRGTSALTGKRHPQRTTHGRILARTRAGICSSASPCFMLTLTFPHMGDGPHLSSTPRHTAFQVLASPEQQGKAAYGDCRNAFLDGKRSSGRSRR